jgi:ketosteroid isomerase-like protein
MKADEKTEADVMSMLNRFIGAYGKKDIDSIEGLFAPDPDVIFYGNGEDEKSIGLTGIRGQAEQDWSGPAKVSLSVKWSSVSAAGSIAWLAADLEICADVEGIEMKLPARVTAVLEKRGGVWFFMQWHASIPTTERMEG